MCSTDRNVIFDQIVAERRSHRTFRPEIPPEDDIRRIIHAGLLAPYAAAAVGTSKDYFRRFFVFRAGTAPMETAARVAMATLDQFARGLEQEFERSPELRGKAGMFVQRLDAIRKMGKVPGIGTAPYYIVVAERRGFPPVEAQSLAHCLENMWLKATALCLGFQVVSITAQMGNNPEFLRVLGLAPGEWELMGCAVGYPKEELSPAIRPPVEDVTVWLS